MRFFQVEAKVFVSYFYSDDEGIKISNTMVRTTKKFGPEIISEIEKEIRSQLNNKREETEVYTVTLLNMSVLTKKIKPLWRI